MTGYRRLLPSRFGARGEDAVSEDVLAALEGTLATDESVEYRLASAGPLGRPGTDAAAIEPREGSGTLAAATDRALVVAVGTPGEPETVRVPYTRIKDVEATDTLVHTRLDVATWGEGTYRIDPDGGADLGAVEAYLARQSDCWDTVAATLGDARQHVAEMGDRLEAGDDAGAQTHRAEAEELLATASRVARTDGGRATGALEGRVDAVARELAETRVRSLMGRGNALVERASEAARTLEFGPARLSYGRARDRFEEARSVAAAWDFDVAEGIEDELARLEERIADVEASPKARADEAAAAAAAAETPERAISRWQEALEMYRTALTAGWGHPEVAFDGETAAVRERVEDAVANLVAARRSLAESLAARGEAATGEAARDRYAAAAQQLADAARLAGQYRAGDCEAIEAQLAAVRERRERVEDGELAAA